MGKMQRNKGARGERELFALLSDGLGLNITRNLVQTRSGGADTMDIPGFAIEVKRQEVLKMSEWWTQTLSQAGDKIPVLAYRQSRKPWHFLISLYDINPEWFPYRDREPEFCATMTTQGFIAFARRRV
ncbi:MAG: hypothetical protein EBR82_32020 [Caulobacteraceae bacterium]|nr:hypothetical protein [Caulobacteraceae bacterium]